MSENLYYYSIHKFDDALAEAGINLARHRHKHKYEFYPYQSHWQPLLAYLALAGCLVILVVFNGVFLWNKFDVIPFLSGYLTVSDLLLSDLLGANESALDYSLHRCLVAAQSLQEVMVTLG